MSFSLIPIFIIIGSLVVIIFIVGKKIPQLKVLDVKTVTEEKDSQTKQRIIRERLQRKSAVLKRKLLIVLKPVFQAIYQLMKGIYSRVISLEKEYKKATTSRRAKISELLIEAQNNATEENFDKAEESYIKIIELDGRNLKAYEGLGEFYLLKKDYKKSEESFSHLLKLLKNQQRLGAAGEHEISECLTKLGEVKQSAGNLREAFSYFKKAKELEPNNPKYLDLLLKTSIILKDKTIAKSALAALRTADPENQKLAELEKEVGEIK